MQLGMPLRQAGASVWLGLFTVSLPAHIVYSDPLEGLQLAE
jgi:hypothetical protein